MNKKVKRKICRRPPRVTVLMPAHNAAATIAEAARSILAQSWRDLELLIVDDASSDETVSILESLRDPRVRVVRSSERLKLAGALNLGLREARGEYVARMDADDVALPNRLALQVRFLDRHPDIAICGSSVVTFGDGSPERLSYPTSPEEVRAFALFNCPFAHPAVMFRREALVERGLFYDVAYYPTEDYELWSRALRALRGANLPDVLLRYRRHAASLTGGQWTQMDRQAARVQARLLGDLGLPHDEESTLRHRAWATGRIEPALSALRAAEAHVQQIARANDSKRIYDSEALARVVAERWFTLAMRCAAAGWAVWSCFARSPLSGGGLLRLRRCAILAASIARRARRVAA
jgi:hypothetical protein